MDKKKLKEILKNHVKWLNGNDGERLNLQGAYLREANLLEADLREANLRGADFRKADLRGANLREANLRGANLREANLRGANLRKANIRGADLWGANLRGADFWGADLWRANLREANLRGADLREANLRGANLWEADLREAKLPDFQICPEEGSFIAWKKLDTGICKLLIPEDAKRTSCLINRKCRASHAKDLEGNGRSKTVNSKLEYREGNMVYADKFCDDIRLDCSHGIHFFMTRKEAEEW